MGEQTSQEKINMMRNLFNQGLKIMDIANAVGVSRSTVKNYKKKYNMVSNYVNIRAKLPGDKIKEIKELEAQGLGTKAISEQLGVSDSAVRTYKIKRLPQRNNMIYEGGKLPQDKINQILILADQGYTITAIAKKLGITSGTSKNYIKKYRPNYEFTPKIKPISKDKLNIILALIDKGMESKEIAEVVGVSTSIVAMYKKKYRPDANNDDEKSKLPGGTKEIIIALMNKGFTKKDIAETVGLNPTTITKYQRKYRPIITNKAFRPSKFGEDKINVILDLADKGDNLKTIANAVGVSEYIVSKYLKKLRPDINFSGKRKKEYENKLNTILDLFDKGNSQSDIARTIGVTQSTISKQLKKHRPNTKSNGKLKSVINEDRINLLKDLTNREDSLGVINNVVEALENTISNYLEMHRPNINLNVRNTRINENKVNIIIDLANNRDGLRTADNAVGVSDNIVSNYLNNHCPNINNANVNVKLKTSEDKIKMIIDLAKQGFWISSIARTVGVSKDTVSRYLKKHGIPVSRHKKDKLSPTTYSANKGFSVNGIANKIRIPRSTVDYYRNKYFNEKKNNRSKNKPNNKVKKITDLINKRYLKNEIYENIGVSEDTVSKFGQIDNSNKYDNSEIDVSQAPDNNIDTSKTLDIQRS